MRTVRPAEGGARSVARRANGSLFPITGGLLCRETGCQAGEWLALSDSGGPALQGDPLPLGRLLVDAPESPSAVFLHDCCCYRHKTRSGGLEVRFLVPGSALQSPLKLPM